jgi:hypothetical protein
VLAKNRREKRLTVRKFGEQWTSTDLYRLHGEINGLKPKASSKDDEYRLKRYVYPVIGDKAVADVTEDDAKRVMKEADSRARKLEGVRRLRPATRFRPDRPPDARNAGPLRARGPATGRSEVRAVSRRWSAPSPSCGTQRTTCAPSRRLGSRNPRTGDQLCNCPKNCPKRCSVSKPEHSQSGIFSAGAEGRG